ncbi:ribonucleotide reductase of class Ia [Klebsiella pneumoniae]|uniref:Ribonucleotide reductase of class Ia n=1 Tax=Klebsiella pneumoniae TaxID=573 RepID=A0A377TYX0_KLEPN|nr:ribonucleotide reductase of class Ia [Klebsiella pneumoniae]
MSIKASKDGILRQVVPDYENLQNAYELLWEMPNNDGYLQLVGIMQKFYRPSTLPTTNTIRRASRPEKCDAAVAQRPAQRL